ncbi:MAG: MOSC domain-containing protein [Planctomycetota bacterium]|jgi:MOSC domain-containing protein YiiM
MPNATVISVNISGGGIPKQAIDVGDVTPAGLAGDAHDHEKHNTPLQAISLLDVEDLDALRSEGFAVGPGATGENLTCRGLDIDGLGVGDILRLTGGVALELTKRRKPCYVLDAIDPTLKTAAHGRIGFYAKVLTPGSIRAGEAITVEPGEHADAD